jgi:GH18 family chitinase
MCYDYHGKWDKKTGHNAPLHSRATEPAADQVRGRPYYTSIKIANQYLINFIE